MMGRLPAVPAASHDVLVTAESRLLFQELCHDRPRSVVDARPIFQKLCGLDPHGTAFRHPLATFNLDQSGRGEETVILRAVASSCCAHEEIFGATMPKCLCVLQLIVDDLELFPEARGIKHHKALQALRSAAFCLRWKACEISAR